MVKVKVKFSPPNPPSIFDLMERLSRGTSDLRVKKVASRYQILYGGRWTPEIPKQAALLSLCFDAGFTEDDARRFLDEADRTGQFQGRVKYAETFKKTAYDPVVPNSWGGPPMSVPPMGSEGYFGEHQAYYPLQEQIPIPGTSASETWDPMKVDHRYTGNATDMDTKSDDRRRDLTEDEVVNVDRANQLGRKDIFETGIVGQIPQIMDPARAVDQKIPTLIKGLSNLGELLWIVSWHGETLADRYGMSNVDDLLDSMRNCFDAQGKLVFKLRQHLPAEEYGSQEYADLEPVAEG
jgi:hypothetical protein